MTESLATLIRAQPFLSGFADEHVELIAGCASNVRFAPGERLFREGQPANVFYLLRSGRVEISVHGAQRGRMAVQTLGGGEMVGWSWLVPPYRARFEATATEDTRALGFDGECLRGKCEEHPSMGFALLKKVSSVLAQRLEASRIQMMDVYGGGTSSQ